MDSKMIWYILLPKRHTYVGPFSTDDVVKSIFKGLIKINSHVWYPQMKGNRWKMAIEYPCFQKVLKSPQWLFSLSELEYLEVYRLVNGISQDHEARESWYEEFRKTQKSGDQKTEMTQSDIDLIPLPKRSKRFKVEQTFALHHKGHNVLKASHFTVSKNGVYLRVKANKNYAVGKYINLSTKDHINQQVLHLNGLITSEENVIGGKGFGIRFVKISASQRVLIDNWVRTLAVDERPTLGV